MIFPAIQSYLIRLSSIPLMLLMFFTQKLLDYYSSFENLRSVWKNDLPLNFNVGAFGPKFRIFLNLISSVLTVIDDGEEILTTTFLVFPVGNSNTCNMESKKLMSEIYSVSVYVKFILKTTSSRSKFLKFHENHFSKKKRQNLIHLKNLYQFLFCSYFSVSFTCNSRSFTPL